ncbi:MAG: DUF4956 domain-containing protein [Gemmiger sp.]|nr:DUF4956 domain-containing protein [Gemmiger sp.]
MLDSIFTSYTTSITLPQVLVCTLVSLALGLACAGVYMFRTRYNKSFVVTLVLLPAVVQMVIMLVNGNVGTGVAVAGAFSLVRFRSLPGSAREIGSIFLAMAVGLATGTGYLGVAAVFVLLLGGASLLLNASPFGNCPSEEKELKISVPEALEYEDAFGDLLARYTQQATLESVKTTNMGSLFELRYRVQLRAGVSAKAFLDDLRTRNGNLTVQLARLSPREDQL